jgi:hypothetical protein
LLAFVTLRVLTRALVAMTLLLLSTSAEAGEAAPIAPGLPRLAGSLGVGAGATFWPTWGGPLYFTLNVWGALGIQLTDAFALVGEAQFTAAPGPGSALLSGVGALGLKLGPDAHNAMIAGGVWVDGLNYYGHFPLVEPCLLVRFQGRIAGPFRFYVQENTSFIPRIVAMNASGYVQDGILPVFMLDTGIGLSL